MYKTETWDQLVATNGYIWSDNVYSNERGVIRNTISHFSNTATGDATNFTVALVYSGGTTVLARDVTVPNRCT